MLTTAYSRSTERLLRGCESAISSPNGIGQAMITKLMLEWGYDGYIRWLRGIKATYAMRRDWMVGVAHPSRQNMLVLIPHLFAV